MNPVSRNRAKHLPCLLSASLTLGAAACSRGQGSSAADEGDETPGAGGTEAGSDTLEGGVGDDLPSLDEGAEEVSEGPGEEDGDTGDPSFKFDLGSFADIPDQGDDGCAKVDFLFVIDNSGSMADEQQALIRSFPGFMTSIRETLEIEDFHVMAVDTDEAAGFLTLCLFGDCTCEGDETECCPEACKEDGSETCNGVACSDWPISECGPVLGSGRTRNGEAGRACDFADDRRYVTPNHADLHGAFSCAASVGTMGDGQERPMDAMRAAVSPELSGPGGCNDGFVRDDAILVVTVITDEEDKGSTEGPEAWKADLVAAKHGNADAIVVLGLIGDLDTANPICSNADDGDGGAEASPILRQFIRAFGPRGLDASICAPDYIQFFEQAVGLVDGACDDFDPPE